MVLFFFEFYFILYFSVLKDYKVICNIIKGKRIMTSNLDISPFGHKD